MQTKEYSVEKKKKLQTEVVKATMAKNGSIWLTANGYSMNPLLRNDDKVEIKPVPFEGLKPGNIVATKEEHQVNDITTHRLVKKLENPRLLLTRGDNNNLRGYDNPIEARYLIGRVVTVKRGSDIIKIDNFLWNTLGHIIVKLSPIMPKPTKIFLSIISLFSIPRLTVPKIFRPKLLKK